MTYADHILAYRRAHAKGDHQAALMHLGHAIDVCDNAEALETLKPLYEKKAELAGKKGFFARMWAGVTR